MAEDRSAAAAAASRRNGARSKGPCTAKGKAASARNSLKHGLFSSVAGPLSPSPAVAELGRALMVMAGKDGSAAWHIDTAISAAARLEQATAIVQHLRWELGELLERDDSAEQLGLVLGNLVRMARYERRFRGRRDRALRALIATSGGQ